MFQHHSNKNLWNGYFWKFIWLVGQSRKSFQFSAQVSAGGNHFLAVIPLLLLIATRWTERKNCIYTFKWVVPYFRFIQANTLASISSFILFNRSFHELLHLITTICTMFALYVFEQDLHEWNLGESHLNRWSDNHPTSETQHCCQHESPSHENMNK